VTLVVIKKKRIFIWERDQGCCWLCGRAVTLEDMTLDHVVPKSKGGKANVENLKAACFECNNKRGNGDPRPEKKHNKRRHKSQPKSSHVRGPAMGHITNENAKEILTTDERIAMQKRAE
jgi:5-methylcytosine-specific restriction endonuclease McrA